MFRILYIFHLIEKILSFLSLAQTKRVKLSKFKKQKLEPLLKFFRLEVYQFILLLMRCFPRKEEALITRKLLHKYKS